MNRLLLYGLDLMARIPRSVGSSGWVRDSARVGRMPHEHDVVQAAQLADEPASDDPDATRPGSTDSDFMDPTPPQPREVGRHERNDVDVGTFRIARSDPKNVEDRSRKHERKSDYHQRPEKDVDPTDCSRSRILILSFVHEESGTG